MHELIHIIMGKTRISEAKIDQLIPDDLNANKGTEFGQHLMDKSFRELGAGRSILLDRNGRIIAGNKSTEMAASIGMDDVIIVETDGTKLVAVKRIDIDLDSEKGRSMALADNATSKANLAWDNEALVAIQSQWDVDLEDWGIRKFEPQTEDINPDDFDDFSKNIAENSDEFSITFVFNKKHEKAIKSRDKIELTNLIINHCK